MNARVLLLVIITGLFMAAWDGDQAAMQASIARRDLMNSQRVARATCPSQPTSLPVKTVSVDHAISAPTIVVPRPEGIAAGTYQAVNQKGRTVRINVENSAARNAREFYTVDAPDGDRWYLIRVQPGN